MTNKTHTLWLHGLWLLVLLPLNEGITVTWGYVNKYASTLHAEDVYLEPHDISLDIAYPAQNVSNVYTISAIHAYDLTQAEAAAGDADETTALLLSGGVGQQHAVVRLQRLRLQNADATNNNMNIGKNRNITVVHFQLVIYGVDL
ncbi:uncharacterized protein LOC115629837 [Scaptodrosophila lebanonensis]|uniref:Uncharacterized protein LOC115629837 n=1 Tax=Drosophila lebanonensis TaxID=7225 RepID=A0A6J2U553_DROLE|nr:uncharacterized protein LOC115629837 [Scaptodrosophila lebanonensis]